MSLDDPHAVVEVGGGGGPREVDHAPALHGVEGAAVRDGFLRPGIVWRGKDEDGEEWMVMID